MIRAPENTRIYIQDVMLRDGFQMEPDFIPTDTKVSLASRLSEAGISKIEVSSFTSPKAIPTLADADAVFERIRRYPDVTYTALVPNVRGCERALACHVDELNVVVSVSETHNLANLRMRPEESLEQIAQIAQRVGDDAAVNVSVSTAFGCPFEGRISDDQVFAVIDQLPALGINLVTVCDTTGVANPTQVFDIFAEATRRWPEITFTAHFHNTRGLGLANVVAALDSGISSFDGSLGGLGGCPYAPGASGNVCTEDLVHMLEAMGYDTGVDLGLLLAAAADLPEIVGHEVPGQVLKAGPWDRRYPKPGWLANGKHQRPPSTSESASRSNPDR